MKQILPTLEDWCGGESQLIMSSAFSSILGNCLAVHWLRRHAVWTRVQSLMGKLRSHRLHSVPRSPPKKKILDVLKIIHLRVVEGLSLGRDW